MRKTLFIKFLKNLQRKPQHHCMSSTMIRIQYLRIREKKLVQVEHIQGPIE
jgi:hypothetical protein